MNFLVSDSTLIIGKLSLAASFDLQSTQRDAWVEQVAVLKGALAGLSGTILFEFTIPDWVDELTWCS